jgi:uncharacterized glyoxalase superfamily protein PhnB
MAKKVNPVPSGYHSVIPTLVVRGAAQAIDFYTRAFGAKEIMRMPGPDGKSILHAEIKIGDSHMFLSDELPNMSCRSPQTLGGTAGSIFLYLEDADKVFNQAVAAGAKVRMALSDMFWGDRFGSVTDPFGHEWGLATHIEDVAPEEMEKRSKVFFAQMAKQQKA